MRRLTGEQRIQLQVIRRRRRADAQARRRASFYTDEVEDVSIDVVYKRDNETCHLCGQWVSVHDMTLDHVVPLARGGSHTYDNIKLAHAVCNSKKGASHACAGK